MLEYDVAIIGGGLVGASCAHALAKSKFKFALLDRQPAAQLYTPEHDNRGIGLAYSSIKLLTSLGVWDKIKDTYPIHAVHVSEQGCFGISKLTAKNLSLSQLGAVVSSSDLARSLFTGLEAQQNLDIYRPVTIKGLCFDTAAKVWTIVTPEHKIKAKLIVAADGTNSFIRQRQNIEVETTDFHQLAVVSNLYLRQDHQNIAYERFTDVGPLALLPFGPKRMKLVWSVDPSFAEKLSSADNHEIIKLVQQAMGYSLGEFISLDKCIQYPIKQVIAKNIYGQAVVLLGNAANTLNPIAAQGYNLGLRDAIDLAQALTWAQKKNLPVNCNMVLEHYASLRKNDHKATIGSTNILANLYNSTALGAKFARRSGLLATNFIKPLNKKLMLQGIGFNSNAYANV